MKPILNKWQSHVSFRKDYSRMESGWSVLTCAICNFTKLPPSGECYRKDDYKGFIIRLRIWLPIEKY